MQRGELRRCHPLATAVRSDLVVVLSPGGDGCPGLAQRLEPLFIQAFVTELAIETFDVAVLHGAARLDEEVPDAVRVCPGHEGPAGELRAVVSAHYLRVAPEDRSLVQQPGDVLARDAPVHGNAHTFVAEVVGHGQALDAPPGAQAEPPTWSALGEQVWTS